MRLEFSKLFILTLCLLSILAPLSLCCSRSYSKAARNILAQKGVLKFLALYTIPENCPLKPTNDIFGLQEEHKFQDPFNQWGCGLCGKFFKTEHFLDLHFDRKHDNERKSGPKVTCLADFCEILRCDIVNEYIQTTYWEMALCVDSKFDILRDICRRAIQNCVDTSLDERNVEFFLNKTEELLCSDLKCEKYYNITKDTVSDYLLYLLKYLWCFLSCLLIFIVYSICCCVKMYQMEMNERSKHTKRVNSFCCCLFV